MEPSVVEAGADEDGQQPEKLYSEKDIKLMPNYIDPYKHQKKYINNRLKQDPEFKKKVVESARKRTKERYHTDPEFRARKIAAERERKKRKKAEAQLVTAA